MNGHKNENAKVKSESVDFVTGSAQPTTLSREVHAVKMNLDDPSKRKLEEAPDSSDRGPTNKKSKRADQARAVRSSQMDSIATVGKQVESPRRDTEDESHEIVTMNLSISGPSPSEAVVGQFVELTALPENCDALAPLTNTERKELERYLDFSKEETWRGDWIGNLCFADKDVSNPDGKSRERSKKALFHWAEKGKLSRKLLNNLVRHVYNLDATPPQAKKILGSADPNSVESIQDAVRRVSYDPTVLEQDGWTTIKSKEPVGASGGPFRIGERVFWQGFEGVVIAYVHDHDIGDLWKAMWLEELDTFDLEVEELEDARRRFERKMKQKEVKGA